MYKYLIIAIALCFSFKGFAQEGTTSPYSFYGLGELKFKGTVEDRMMAGIGMVSDSIHINLQNPAGLADLKLVTYSLGGSFKSRKLSNETQSQTLSTTTLDYLAIGIPMGKISASFGLIPYTSVGYRLFANVDDENRQYTGEGGVNKAFLSFGYKVTPELSIGVSGEYNFGAIENSILIQNDLDLSTGRFDKSSLSGLSLNFGAQYKTMLTTNLEFSSAATFSPKADLTTQNERQLFTLFINTETGSQTIIDRREIPIADGTLTLPSRLSFGMGLGKPKNWFIGGEYLLLKTSEFNSTTTTIANVSFKDATTIKLGGYFIPKYNAFDNYWKRVVYKAGIRFEETGLQINQEDINEFGISFGVSLPVGKLFSNMNLGFEIGKRGTKKQGLVQENFFNTIISLSLNDKWFQKRYYD